MPHASVIDLMEHRDEIIRSAAYSLWEEAGQPEGRAEEFWLTAETNLRTNFGPLLLHLNPSHLRLIDIPSIRITNRHL